MATQTLILIAGFLASAIAGYLLSSKENFRVSVRDSFLSSVLGTSLLTMFFVQLELSAFRGVAERVVAPNALEHLSRIITESTTEPLLRQLVEQKARIETELQELARGRVALRDEGDVIDAWSQSFTSAVASVNAINLVAPDFWLHGTEFSAKQHDIQKAARARGVAIRRMFILASSSDEEIAAVNALAEDQRALGIEVRFLRLPQVLASPAYGKYSSQLSNAIDLVLFDLNVVLATFTNPDSHKIQRGVLSSERTIVDAATAFFERLWSMASTEIRVDRT